MASLSHVVLWVRLLVAIVYVVFRLIVVWDACDVLMFGLLVVDCCLLCCGVWDLLFDVWIAYGLLSLWLRLLAWFVWLISPFGCCFFRIVLGA